jgi:hypothetical protein
MISIILGASLLTNPFLLDIPQKKGLSTEDYVDIQKQIDQLTVEPLVESLYPNPVPHPYFATLKDMRNRCSRGRDQKIIDPEKGYFPQQHLLKIGAGGGDCVVCCVPFNGKYPELVRSIAKGLEEQQFNGYFYYRIGGFPNPTGKEVKYVAVPYCFKIFLMLEAYQMGFNRVLWIDSACYPIWRLDELFVVIEKTGALLNWWVNPNYLARFIFPQTFDLLMQLTGTDVINSKYVNTTVFGLKMDSPEVQNMITNYYEFVDLGTPFLSCFPEEFVLTSIINQEKYRHWLDNLVEHLIGGYFFLREER